jgi:hypothetical protein
MVEEIEVNVKNLTEELLISGITMTLFKKHAKYNLIIDIPEEEIESYVGLITPETMIITEYALKDLVEDVGITVKNKIFHHLKKKQSNLGSAENLIIMQPNQVYATEYDGNEDKNDEIQSDDFDPRVRGAEYE